MWQPMAQTPGKKKKKGNALVDYAAYLAVRMAAVFIQLGHVNTSLRVARGLGRLLYRHYRRGRERALENLRLGYPEKSAAWHERTARRSFEHLVMFAFDILYAPRLIRSSNWRHHIEFGNMAEALQLMLSGRGVIMITGHYGNFEVLGRTMDTFGLHSYNIARPIDNRFINKYVYEELHRGQTIIFKKGATELMHDILTSGSALGIVGDQNGSRKDVFVDFFGRKAATYKSVALMAMTYEVPIVVGYARRLGDGYSFELGVSRVIMPQQWRDQPDPIRWLTAEWTKGIEDFVRRDPEQYWWIHRRWKTRPADEIRKIASEGT